jgi:arylsulfatase A-like enzyme
MISRREALKLAGASAISIASRAAGLDKKSDQTKKPNVLFVLCDQLNLRLLSCYGGPIRTPNLDRLCQNGVRFDNAVCTYPVCSPNRATLITGLYPHTHGIVYNVSNADYPERAGPDTEQGINLVDNTLGKLFHNAGYETHHYGKWHLDGQVLPYYPDPYDDQHQYLTEMEAVFRQVRRQPRDEWMQWYGWSLPVTVSPVLKRAADAIRQQGHIHPEFLSKSGRLDLPLTEVFDVRVADKTIQRLEEMGEVPFCLTASFNEPHDPNVVPAPYYDMVSPSEVEIPRNFEVRESRFEKDWSRSLVVVIGEDGLREMLRIYYASVMLMDSQVGRLLDALERTGNAANTLVVFTTDHGDMAGGHGMFWKNTECFYEDVVRVPLIISHPAILRPGIVKRPVSSADVLPTILGLSGMPVPIGVEGDDLTPVLRGAQRSDGEAYSFCERITSNAANIRQFVPGMRGSFMARSLDWKYIQYWDGDEYLYDLSADAGETRNLAHTAEHDAKKRQLQSTLAAWKARTHCPKYA